MGATPGLNKERRLKLTKKHRLCPICPLHRGENANNKDRRKRTDKYKNKREK